MPEPWRLTDDELAGALGEVGEHLDYPRPGRLAAVVRERVEEGGERPTVRSWMGAWLRGDGMTGATRRLWQPIAATAVLVVAVFVGSLVAFPTVRQTVADWLGLRGIGITVVPSLSPIPTQHGALQLGAPMSLDEARAAVSWPILLPDDPALGAPDEVYVDRSALASGTVSLVWSARPGYPAASTTGAGLLVTELRARIDERFFQKVIGPGTTIEGVHVGAQPGYWISGQPHELFLLDEHGNPIPQRIRVAGNVLMWEVGDVTLRVESALTKDEALRVGSSIH